MFTIADEWETAWPVEVKLVTDDSFCSLTEAGTIVVQSSLFQFVDFSILVEPGILKTRFSPG